MSRAYRLSGVLAFCIAVVLVTVISLVAHKGQPSADAATSENSGQHQHGAGSDEKGSKESNGEEAETGPHHGRLLHNGALTLEIAIFEKGTPPEFRIWVTENGKLLDPRKVGVTVELSRLGGKQDHIGFTPKDDFLRGDSVVHEPHSFKVTVKARYKGVTHRWQYESVEGRTRIDPEIAKGLEIQTAIAGPAVLLQHNKVYGRLVMNPEQVREVRARFEGRVDAVKVKLGERVTRGQPVIAINSNENLQTYTVNSPINGVVLQREANSGEQTAGRNLLVIGDDRALQAELEVFPATRKLIHVGDPVFLKIRDHTKPLEGVVQSVDPIIRANQASIVRVALKNPTVGLAPGAFVSADVQVAAFDVALAVKRSALQRFRDFTVVFAQFGDQYEVRMVELGREGRDWVEILGGLDPGTRYVSENSYIIKADIEKSGAAHDH